MTDGKKRDGVDLTIVAICMIGLLLISCYPLFRSALPEVGDLADHRLVFLGIQSLTVVCVYFLFRIMGEPGFALYGCLYYMISPIQICLAYDAGDLGGLLFRLCLPMLALGLLLLIRVTIRDKKVLAWPAGCLLVAAAAAGSYRALSGNDSGTGWFLSERGYRFGQLFTSYFYRDDHPGLGIGLVLALGFWLYLTLGNGKKKMTGAFLAGCVLTAISLFPIVLKTPPLLLGIAEMLFCFPAAWAMWRAKDIPNPMLRNAVRVVGIGVTLAVGIFLENRLMYFQFPIVTE